MGKLTDTVRNVLRSVRTEAWRCFVCHLALVSAAVVLTLCAVAAMGQEAQPDAAAAAKAVVENLGPEERKALIEALDAHAARRDVLLKAREEAVLAQPGAVLVQVQAAAEAASADDAAAETPAETGDESDRFIEESGLVETYLERIKSLVAEGDLDTVAELVPRIVEIGPESVVKGTGLGAAQSLTELILSWSPEVRRKYEAALGPQADEALKAAGEVGTLRALTNVVRDFPGTQASRRARAIVWARRLEAGELTQAAELLHAGVADPMMPEDERRQALFLLAMTEAGSGRADEARAALGELKTLGGKVVIGGREIDVDQELSAWLTVAAAHADEWPQVGGRADRSGRMAVECALGGPIVLHSDDKAGGFTVTTDHIPSRRESLARRESRDTTNVERSAAATSSVLVNITGSQLVGLDRMSGAMLWKLDLVQSGQSLDFVTWPSCGDGCVAVVRRVGGGAGRARNGRFIYYNNQSFNLGSSLVVVRQDTGRELWSWDGRSLDPDADLWNAAGRKADEAAGIIQRRPDAPKESGEAMELAGSPLVYGGRVFLGVIKSPQYGQPSDCYLMCFDLRTGRVLWQRFIGSGNPLMLRDGGNALNLMSPSTDGQTVFAESAVGSLAAVDLATGQTRWARRLPWPKASSAYEMPTVSWPSNAGSSPTVADGRVIVSEIGRAGMSCFDSRTGRKLWSVATMPGGQRVGVSDGRLVVAGGARLVAYDLNTGEELLAVRLDSEISGRGFVSGHWAYIPTLRGIVRANIETKAAETVYLLKDDVPPPTALVPLGRDMASCHSDRVLLFGPVDDFLEGMRRGIALHSEDPAWPRRLAELYHQKGAYAEAEAHLQQSLALAEEIKAAEESQRHRLLAHQALEQLYVDWSRTLSAAGQSEEAGRKLALAEKYLTRPESRVAVWMASAQHHEQAGHRDQAAEFYRRVAAEEMAQRMFVTTRTLGLERSVASQATMALERLNMAARDERRLPGLLLADVDRLEVHVLAMQSWSAPSYLTADVSHDLTPLVWARPDGLVAFGRNGEVRWRYARADSAPGGRQVSAVQTHAGQVVDRQLRGVSVHRQSDGELLWQWTPDDKRALAELDVVTGMAGGAKSSRYAIQANIFRDMKEWMAPQDGWYQDFTVTPETVAVVVRDPRTRTSLTVLGLRRTDGEVGWESPWNGVTRYVGMRSDGQRVVAASLSAQGGLVLRCLDATTGKLVWDAAPTEVGVFQGPWLMGHGVIVACGTEGTRVAVDVETGRTLWSSSPGVGVWAKARPVALDAHRVLYAYEEGYVALDLRTGAFQWQAKVLGPADGQPDLSWPERVALTDDLMIVPACDGAMALRLSDGAIRWRVTVPVRLAEDMAAVTLAGEVAVVYDRHARRGLLHLVDVRTGKLVHLLDVGEASDQQDASQAGRQNGNSGIRVWPIPGGLAVQLGDEMLTVTPKSPLAEGGPPLAAAGGRDY
jgi:outer membrane protein assembly factor BamB